MRTLLFLISSYYLFSCGNNSTKIISHDGDLNYVGLIGESTHSGSIVNGEMYLYTYRGHSMINCNALKTLFHDPECEKCLSRKDTVILQSHLN